MFSPAFSKIMYQIKIEKFEGPLDLLLSLIEKEKLDIAQVSLAQVTEQYIRFIEKSESISPDELADFLVIAAKLLLIKSKILLPYLQSEEEDAGLELEEQLRMYKLFALAAADMEKIIKRKKFSYFREGDRALEAVFVPPENIGRDDLRNLFHAIVRGIEPVAVFKKRAAVKAVSLREKINYIQGVILKAEKSNFTELLSQARSKTEIIVTFLALLELVKQKDVAVVQNNIFSDIMIKKINEDHP